MQISHAMCVWLFFCLCLILLRKEFRYLHLVQCPLVCANQGALFVFHFNCKENTLLLMYVIWSSRLIQLLCFLSMLEYRTALCVVLHPDSKFNCNY